ncbi:hypothetical protein FHX74_001000 [Friedmanniella endophytica]|uniref:Uncharacterized protein n=1 Tax=Microlunatus kandeliicorticis TaxID=1759536 RepID=A0A7W3P508_9ACTN|nr:hypothetical protein [Microlunatus kandeliicorticis]
MSTEALSRLRRRRIDPFLLLTLRNILGPYTELTFDVRG